MTKLEMKKLLKKHCKLQMEANFLERQILNEVEKYKPNSQLFYELACIPDSEPQNVAGVVMEEIGEYLK